MQLFIIRVAQVASRVGSRAAVICRLLAGVLADLPKQCQWVPVCADASCVDVVLLLPPAAVLRLWCGCCRQGASLPANQLVGVQVKKAAQPASTLKQQTYWLRHSCQHAQAAWRCSPPAAAADAHQQTW